MKQIPILKILTTALILSLIISSIFIYRYRAQNDFLSQENSRLVIKLDSISKMVGEEAYLPIVIENKSKIKLGEEYYASIYLARSYSKNIPIVIVGEINDGTHNTNLFNDTLKYDTTYNTFLYNNLPKKVGIYNWGGLILLKKGENELDELRFEMSFEVTQ